MSDANGASSRHREEKDSRFVRTGRYLLSAAWLVYALFFVAGLIGFWVFFTPTTIEGTLRELKSGGSITLVQNSVWKLALMLSIATNLVTVSSFELIKRFLEWSREVIAARTEFNQFWGDRASARGSDGGVILLQEENIEEATKPLSPEASLHFDESHAGDKFNRFFKARIWVNKFDMEAAKHIRAVFWKRGYRPPEMNNDYAIPSGAPFVVSVGLFSDKTKEFVKDYSGSKDLVSIIQTEKDGDAVQIRIEDAETPAFSQVRSKPIVLIPDGWDREKWIDGKSTYDAAIILRHTIATENKNGSSRLIRFVIAGFTEHGTEAAGRYLAENWKDLHERFWRAGLPGRKGDFFLVITGKLNSTDQWSEDHKFTLTPQKMQHMHVNLAPDERLPAGRSV